MIGGERHSANRMRPTTFTSEVGVIAIIVVWSETKLGFFLIKIEVIVDALVFVEVLLLYTLSNLNI
jgi:hypothetical protein